MNSAPRDDRAEQDGQGQDLLDFTVQIRHSRTGAVVGAGILVSRDIVVTCAHVVQDAGVDLATGKASSTSILPFRRPPDEPATVGIRLVRDTGSEPWQGRAMLLSRLPDASDDVVLVKVVGDPAPVRTSQLAVVGRCDLTARNRFVSLGFPELSGRLGFRVQGTIEGPVGDVDRRNLCADPIQLRTDQIARRGMSGSAVVDEQRNLVVGIIERSFIEAPEHHGPGIAWAVDARVLALEPFGLPVNDEPCPRVAVLPPRVDEQAVARSVVDDPGDRMPTGLHRRGMRGMVARATAGPAPTGYGREPAIVGLVGFGGQGKTTLAVEMLGHLRTRHQAPVFWWNFAEGGVDAFFEAATAHLTRGRAGAAGLATTGQRAEWLSGLVRTKDYLFVLDGLEAVQSRAGPEFGTVHNPDLRAFLLSFAAGGRHGSICLVTSRLPLVDLIRVSSVLYWETYVGRLAPGEGRELLRGRGVRGANADIDALVERWAGHALTLALIAGLVVTRFDGDVAKARLMPAPLEGREVDERLLTMMAYYDRHLSAAERSVLLLLAAFRGPVDADWFWRTVASDRSLSLAEPVFGLDETRRNSTVDRLGDLSVLEVDAGSYDLHPLLRQHYRGVLKKQDAQAVAELHERIARGLLELGSGLPDDADLAQLSPVLEAVFHLCCAGRRTEALDVYRDRLELGSTMRLSYRLNAYDSIATLLEAFFPRTDETTRPVPSAGPNPTAEPDLPHGPDRRYVVNRRGVALMNTGQLAAAAFMFERAVAIGERTGDLVGATHSCENLAEVNVYLGRIEASRQAARRALELASRLAGEQRDQEIRDCHCCLGLASTLAGRDDDAAGHFAAAENLQRAIEPERPFLQDIWGIAAADFWRRRGDRDRSRALTESILQLSEQTGLIDDVSICHRLLGELAADDGDPARAAEHLTRAVEIARTISERTVLLEGLAARGRFYATHHRPAKARADLLEAMPYAEAGGYALLRLDVRVSLGWCHLIDGEIERARTEATECQQDAVVRGYHWGEQDATRLLEAVEASAW